MALFHTDVERVDVATITAMEAAGISRRNPVQAYASSLPWCTVPEVRKALKQAANK